MKRLWQVYRSGTLRKHRSFERANYRRRMRIVFAARRVGCTGHPMRDLALKCL